MLALFEAEELVLKIRKVEVNQNLVVWHLQRSMSSEKESGRMSAAMWSVSCG
jgi:hypothetical protein